MNDYFLLAVEIGAGKYVPVNWRKPYVCSIKEIDDFTSKFVKDDLQKYLTSHEYIKKEDQFYPLQILYSDNGVKKLNSGIMYLDDFSENMILNSMDILKQVANLSNDNNIITAFFEKLSKNNLISPKTKMILNVLNSFSEFYNLDVNQIAEKLKDIPYLDQRIMYLSAKRNIEPYLSQENNKYKNK